MPPAKSTRKPSGGSSREPSSGSSREPSGGSAGDGLVVAVTGPTGTFGFGLVPLLQDERRVKRIVGIARRPFDPSQYGWSKMEYREGDVRDPDALEDAFRDADVVVHLAFMITGSADARTIRAINIDGTLNVYRAACAAGAARFVYASSVAAYGFHRDNPVGMTEDWPTRPADRLFYAREKAEIEELLTDEAEKSPEPALYMVRPPIVLGPHAVGGKDVPGPVAWAGQKGLGLVRRLPIPVPVLAAGIQLQFIHEDDVGRALLRCVLAEGPPGAYNIAGDGVLSGADVARELGFTPVPIPGGVVHGVARAAAAALPPFAPPSAEWIEAVSHPSIMDTSKARQELGWEPKYSGLDALRETIRAAREGD